MKKFLFSFIVILFTLTGNSQILKWDCGDDKLTTLQKQLLPEYDYLQQSKNYQLKQYISQVLQKHISPLFNGRTTSDSTYTIPVVIHVVYPAGESYGTGTNISYAQIRSQLEALNAAFSKNYSSYNGQSHPAYAQNTRIRFCLARTASPDTTSWAVGPGGAEYGVKRYADKSGAYNHTISISSATQLMNITHPSSNYFSFEKYLNIWIVKTIDGSNIAGYAPKPLTSGYPLDGVVIRADIFGDNTTGGNYQLNFGLTQGKVLAHEVGHYLNLYHIFQGGCSGANSSGATTDACDLNGDLICDIKPSTTQHVSCNSAPITCSVNYNPGTTNSDMINDYMSYADDDCMNTFTLNQSQRMWATLDLQRHTLWQSTNLAATGVLGLNGCIPPYLNALISTNNSVYCLNRPVVFSNPTTGNTAKNYQWQFPGGSPSSANSNSTTVTYNIPGNYKAILTVNDGANSRTDSLLFTVVSCMLDSSLSYMAHWYSGEFCSIDFSSGAPVLTNTALAKNTIHGESTYTGQLPYINSTISLSDSSGNLLFYSNGVSVWNANHQKITAIPIFGASDINASTGLCYIPFPGNPSKYFIAGVYPNLDGSSSGIRYVMLDVNTNKVTLYQEFQHPALPNRFSEFLTVVPHCNGTDYWIITHGQGWTNDNRFYSFIVTSSGIDKNQEPVISSHFLQPAYGGAGYQLKSNRQGNKLIMSSPNPSNASFAALYDFDYRTGAITNEKQIPNANGYSNIQTGTSFSPNGEYFYIFRSTNFATNGPPYWLFQYRVSDLQYNLLATSGFYFGSPFQLGPDNQLYTTNGWYYLARLSNPDVWGGASFNSEFINFKEPSFARHISGSLPNFIDARQPQPSHPNFSTKAINCNSYQFSAICFDNYTATWNFGDGSNQQMGNSIVHTFTKEGNYNVTLTLSNSLRTFGSTTKKITILPLSISINGPDSVCNNNNFSSQYFSQKISNVNYIWSAQNGSISGPDNLDYVNVIWKSGNEGKLFLNIYKDNCILNSSKIVKLNQPLNISWVLKDSVCISGTSIPLIATPTGGVFSGKGVSNNIFSPAIAGVGIHKIIYSFNESICYTQVEKNIKVSRCNVIIRSSPISCETILNTIQVLPNPVNEILQLKSPYSFKFGQLYNLVGEKLTDIEIVNNSLSLSFISRGIYILRVYCEKQQSFKAFRILKLK